jgi:hypothetical protein
MDDQVVTKLRFMKLIVQKVLSSSTLPKTITMANSTSFTYFDNSKAIMALEAICPHNYVMKLQSSGKCKAP